MGKAYGKYVECLWISPTTHYFLPFPGPTHLTLSFFLLGFVTYKCFHKQPILYFGFSCSFLFSERSHSYICLRSLFLYKVPAQMLLAGQMSLSYSFGWLCFNSWSKLKALWRWRASSSSGNFLRKEKQHLSEAREELWPFQGTQPVSSRKICTFPRKGCSVGDASPWLPWTWVKSQPCRSSAGPAVIIPLSVPHFALL